MSAWRTASLAAESGQCMIGAPQQRTMAAMLSCISEACCAPCAVAPQEKNVTFSARLTKMETKMYQSFNGTGGLQLLLQV